MSHTHLNIIKGLVSKRKIARIGSSIGGNFINLTNMEIFAVDNGRFYFQNIDDHDTFLELEERKIKSVTYEDDVDEHDLITVRLNKESFESIQIRLEK